MKRRMLVLVAIVLALILPEYTPSLEQRVQPSMNRSMLVQGQSFQSLELIAEPALVYVGSTVRWGLSRIGIDGPGVLRIDMPGTIRIVAYDAMGDTERCEMTERGTRVSIACQAPREDDTMIVRGVIGIGVTPFEVHGVFSGTEPLETTVITTTRTQYIWGVNQQYLSLLSHN